MRLLSFCVALSLAAPLAAQEADSRLQVTVDPRLELMSVVQILADYGWTGLLNTDDLAYRREVDAWFARLKSHAAVQTFAAASRRGYAFDAPPSTMVCLSNPPALVREASAADCGASRFGGAAALDQWLRQLRDFSTASNFMAFFDEHADFYARLVEETRQKLLADYAAQLEDYYGARQVSYTLILTSLLKGNYGVRVPQSEGAYAVFAVLGAAGQTGGVPQFGQPEGLRQLLWHEFGHSFVNPAVDLYRAQFDATEQLYQPIAAKMQSQAYNNWYSSVIEHVVRAAVARVTARQFGEDAGQIEVLRQRGSGFAYVPALYSRLQEYEADRETWPAFAGFAPRLLAVFDEIATQDLGPDFFRAPYAGNINSVFADRDRVVIVVPTAEDDPVAQAAIRDYAQRIRDALLKGAPILDDQAALERDLSRNAVVAYGTLDGNLWLKRYRDRMPVQIVDGGIVAGEQQFTGGNLRLILSMPNPDNPDAGIVAYTAVHAADVVGINSLNHGSTGYVVADGANILKAGNYRLQNGTWVVE